MTHASEEQVYASGRHDPDPPITAKADDKTYQCLHCGGELRKHEDAVGSLHCFDPRCNNCCFYPPAEFSDQVRERVGARPCPMRSSPTP